MTDDRSIGRGRLHIRPDETLVEFSEPVGEMIRISSCFENKRSHEARLLFRRSIQALDNDRRCLKILGVSRDDEYVTIAIGASTDAGDDTIADLLGQRR